MYHIELLEEGLACYLNDPKMNHHEKYISMFSHLYKINEYCDGSLIIPEAYKATGYIKAASFVKFFIETYGLERFRELYEDSVIDRKDNIFMVNNHIIPKTYLYELLEKVFNKNPLEIQINWNKELVLYLLLNNSEFCKTEINLSCCLKSQ